MLGWEFDQRYHAGPTLCRRWENVSSILFAKKKNIRPDTGLVSLFLFI